VFSGGFVDGRHTTLHFRELDVVVDDMRFLGVALRALLDGRAEIETSALHIICMKR